MIIARAPVCLVLSAPSGAGKTSLTHALLKADPSLRLSISWTTRQPRAGEADGVDYHFHTQDAFDGLVEAQGFLEYARVFGRSYGTPRAPVDAWLEAGHDVLFDIDWQGHRQVRAALGSRVIGVFILPPSAATLRQRLTGRGDKPEAVDARMARAADEMSHAGEFDHVIVNDDFATALAQIQSVLTAARCARPHLPGLPVALDTLCRA